MAFRTYICEDLAAAIAECHGDVPEGPDPNYIVIERRRANKRIVHCTGNYRAQQTASMGWYAPIPAPQPVAEVEIVGFDEWDSLKAQIVGMIGPIGVDERLPG